MSSQIGPRVQLLAKRLMDALRTRLPRSPMNRAEAEEALQVWQQAGVFAWKSLRDQMIRDAETAGQAPMPRTDPSQGKLFLRVIRELQSDPDPIGEIWEALSDWLEPAQDLSPIEKRLRYRQSLLAAGRLLDARERAVYALRMEAQALRLEPTDSDWIDDWFA